MAMKSVPLLEESFKYVLLFVLVYDVHPSLFKKSTKSFSPVHYAHPKIYKMSLQIS
jgi:hypothetical protein